MSSASLRDETLTLRRAAYLTVMSIIGLSGCANHRQWDCHRSSQCPNRQFCRVGRCVPAVGFNGGDAAADVSLGGDATDATVGCPDGSPPGVDTLVLNEVLANVPAGDDGDANGDGVRDAYDDEFVELVNRSEATLDITQITIRNGSTDKYTFGSTCLPAHQAAIVFGGGQPTEQPAVIVRVASSRLALANGGGQIAVVDAAGDILDSMTYGESPAEALTLSPQLDGTDFVPHTRLTADRLLSPGTCPTGEAFVDGCADY